MFPHPPCLHFRSLNHRIVHRSSVLLSKRTYSRLALFCMSSNTPSILIPFDVAEEILNNLHLDRDTLKSTSLASRSFQEISQRLLFSKIVFTFSVYTSPTSSAERVARLLWAFAHNPSLVHHARVLQVISESGAFLPDSISMLLENLPHLQAVGLYLWAGTRWEFVPHTVKQAICNLCRLGNLQQLAIFNLYGLPVSLLHDSPQIRRLSLNYTQCSEDNITSYTSVQRGRYSNNSIFEAGSQPKVLELGDTCSVSILIEHHMDPRVSTLRVLRIRGYDPELRLEVKKIQNTFSSTLKCFIWEISDRMDFDYFLTLGWHYNGIQTLTYI